MSASFRSVRFAKDPCTVREDVLFWRTLFLLPFVSVLGSVGGKPGHGDAAQPAAGDPIVATRERYREIETEDL